MRFAKENSTHVEVVRSRLKNKLSCLIKQTISRRIKRSVLELIEQLMVMQVSSPAQQRERIAFVG
jgi:hypothetical protein